MAGSRAIRRAAAGASALVLVAGCGGLSTPRTVDGATDAGINKVGASIYAASHRASAPALSGRTLAGGVLDLASLRGHVVVLNVWASWCGPCKAESPALVAVEHAVAASGVDFVGIDESDDASAARAFLRSVGSDYPNLADVDGRLLARLTMLPPGLPSSLVLDGKGRIAARVVGPTTTAQMTAILRQVLAGT